MTETTCRKCGAPIRMIPTAASGGENEMPVDREPNPEGTLTINDQGLVHVWTKLTVPPGETRYMTHFATCGKSQRAPGWDDPNEVAFANVPVEVVMDAVARDSDPETSWEAARSVTGAKRLREIVLDVLREDGPLTDEQIAMAIETYHPHLLVSPSGLRTRRSELVASGAVQDSGARGKTISGRSSIIWEAVPA